MAGVVIDRVVVGVRVDMFATASVFVAHNGLPYVVAGLVAFVARPKG
jgi:hypothetical protein